MEAFESHETPQWLADKLTELGGKNPHGQPNFRVMWGSSRLAWQGGVFHERDAEGNLLRVQVTHKLTPKYPDALNRWICEMWVPPEVFGTPESWEQETVEWREGQRIETLGPFPRQGEYEIVFVLQTPMTGRCARRKFCECGKCLAYVPLTEAAAVSVLQMVTMSRLASPALRLGARHAWEELQKSRREEEQRLRLDECERSKLFRGPAIVVPENI